MKRVLIGLAIALAGLVVGTVIAVRVFLDPEVLGPLAVERAEAALGREVELANVSLVFFPPALDLEQLRIGGAKPGDPDFATIEAVRLRMSLLPLLTGTIAISALEINAPTIRLDVGKDGLPIAPTFGAPAAAPSPATAPGARPSPDAPSPDPEESGEGREISLTAERVSISSGQVVAGDLRVADLEVSGRVVLDGTTELAIRAEIPGIGRLPDLALTIDRLAAKDRRIVAAGELAELSLGRVAALGKLVPDPLAKLDGRADGTFTVELLGSEVVKGGVDLSLAGLELEMDDLRVRGEIPLAATLGGPLRVDLTAAEIRSADTFAKPTGDRLVITGDLPAALPPKTLPLRLSVPGSDIDVAIDVGAATATLAASEIDLAPLAPWLLALPEKSALRGKVRLPAELRAGGDPLEVRGEIGLESLTLERESGPLVLSGKVIGQGAKVSTQDLVARVGDQPVKIQGGYDLRAGTVDVAVEIGDDARIEPMLLALAGKADVTGALGGRVELRGAPDLEKLGGSGQLDVTKGQVRGFSILEQVIGSLAAVARTAAESRGKDLSRYDEEEFERMGVRFALASGVMQLRPVVIEYRYGRAELRGSMRLVDRTLDLEGDITLTPEVTSDLIGQETTEELVLSGCGVRGTIDDPRVECDRKAMAAVIARVGLQRKIGDRLEEKLGPEGKKAVEGLLEGILGGRKKK